MPALLGTQCAWVGILCCGLAGVPVLPAQNSTSQTIVLKDPTPREPDLEKRFVSKVLKTDSTRLAAYNRERLQLTVRASDHLHRMASVLQTSVTRKQVVTRIAQEAQLAESIETLADHVYRAMANAPTQPPVAKAKGETAIPSAHEQADLTAETDRLMALTAALQIEADKATIDALPVGLLTKSEQVKEIARSLKLRLKYLETSAP